MDCGANEDASVKNVELVVADRKRIRGIRRYELRAPSVTGDVGHRTLLPSQSLHDGALQKH